MFSNYFKSLKELSISLCKSVSRWTTHVKNPSFYKFLFRNRYRVHRNKDYIDFFQELWFLTWFIYKRMNVWLSPKYRSECRKDKVILYNMTCVVSESNFSLVGFSTPWITLKVSEVYMEWYLHVVVHVLLILAMFIMSDTVPSVCLILFRLFYSRRLEYSPKYTPVQ